MIFLVNQTQRNKHKPKLQQEFSFGEKLPDLFDLITITWWNAISSQRCLLTLSWRWQIRPCGGRLDPSPLPLVKTNYSLLHHHSFHSSLSSHSTSHSSSSLLLSHSSPRSIPIPLLTLLSSFSTSSNSFSFQTLQLRYPRIFGPGLRFLWALCCLWRPVLCLGLWG